MTLLPAAARLPSVLNVAHGRHDHMGPENLDPRTFGAPLAPCLESRLPLTLAGGFWGFRTTVGVL